MIDRVQERISQSVKLNMLRNWLGVIPIQLRRNPWPCLDKKQLVVGCESSGTTPIGRLLLLDGAKRFLYEGINTWAWDLYMSVYQGHSSVRDYPALQLFDRIKVPGFASILEQFVEVFPNTNVLYVVRDPRDVLASAYRTKRVSTRQELANIPWVSESWLGIEDQDPVARLARRWRIYLECSRRVAAVHYVRYEDFCRDKVGCIRQLAETMELEIDRQRIEAQCDQQSSDAGARSYRPVGPGSYRQSPHVSEQDAGIVEEICGDLMREWDYL